MSLRIAIKLALGLTVLANPMLAVPVPVVMDSTQILREYAKDREDCLIRSGYTSDETAEYYEKILYTPKINTREGIERFSQWAEDQPDALGEDPFPLYHKFGGGLYTREMHAPKGYVVIGKIHKHESMVYVLKGKLIVADEKGTRTIEAPAQFVCGGGIKRVAYILEDLIWIDIHTTDKTNIEEAEKELFASDYSELDYPSMVESIGHSVEEVRALSENTSDLIDDENDLIEVKNSGIEGKGVFLTQDIKENETIGLSRIDLNRTPVGRYTNHSFNPNSTSVIRSNKIYFVSNSPIDKGEEVTVDYRQVFKTARQLDRSLLCLRQ